jgi:hypothetical protein
VTKDATDTEDEDDDYDSDDDFLQAGQSHINFALTHPKVKVRWSPAQSQAWCESNSIGVETPDFTSPNKFEALDSEKLDGATINQLQQWAQKVHFKQNLRGKAAARKPGETVVRSERQLDNFLRDHPMINALPQNHKQIMRIMESLPKDELKPGERWMLVDSGSAIHGINVEEDAPEYLEWVIESRGSRRGDTAVTACGGTIKDEGKVTIHGTADGVDISIPFKNMKVKMPICSVRKIVKQNNDVIFRDVGGVIRNRATGKEIKIVERDGVYFIKMLIKPPTGDKSIDESASFHRRG